MHIHCATDCTEISDECIEKNARFRNDLMEKGRKCAKSSRKGKERGGPGTDEAVQNSRVYVEGRRRMRLGWQDGSWLVHQAV